MTKVVYAKPPIFYVKVIDWAAVWAKLQKGQEPAYRCTTAQTRAFWQWAQRTHGKPVYYKTVARGVVQFSLQVQRYRPPKEK